MQTPFLSVYVVLMMRPHCIVCRFLAIYYITDMCVSSVILTNIHSVVPMLDDTPVGMLRNGKPSRFYKNKFNREGIWALPLLLQIQTFTN